MSYWNELGSKHNISEKILAANSVMILYWEESGGGIGSPADTVEQFAWWNIGAPHYFAAFNLPFPVDFEPYAAIVNLKTGELAYREHGAVLELTWSMMTEVLPMAEYINENY